VDLAVPQTHLQTVGDQAFCVAAAKTWNSLSSEVTSSAMLPTFKLKLKTYFFHFHFPARKIFPMLLYSVCSAFAFIYVKIFMFVLFDSENVYID